MILNQTIEVAAQLSIDGKAFKEVSGKHYPWDSTSEYLSYFATTRRHEGMIGYIKSGSDIQKWQFVGGFEDSNFTDVSGGSGIEQVVFVNGEVSLPVVGSDEIVYVSISENKIWGWDGANYQPLGNPGPKGNKGDPGDSIPNVLAIGTVTSGPVADATITGTPPSQTLNLVLEKGEKGSDGNDGSPTVTLSVNDVNNPVQTDLNLIDSSTIKARYVAAGKVELSTESKVLAEVKVGTSEAISAGINVGDTSYQNSRLAGNECEVHRSGYLMPSFDLGEDSEYVTKVLVNDYVDFSSGVYYGEWVKIKLV